MKYNVETSGRKYVKSTHVFEFESIRELLTYNKKPASNVFSNPNNQQSITGKKSFTMTENFAEAMELLNTGWDAGTTRLNTALKVANKTNASEVKKAVFDIVGFQASVPRYLQGIPTNMVNKRNVKQKQRIVTLNKSISYSAGVRAEQILKESVAFMQIVQEIEKQGIRCNVNVVFKTNNDNEQIFIKTRIKSASERLNLSKMSFPLLHPSFLRRIMFKTVEVTEQLKESSWVMGYGRPGDHADMKKYLGKDEYLYHSMDNPEAAKEFIASLAK
jgi:hypothetical protein